MQAELQRIIENLMAIQLWKFDGLPDQIISKLDELIAYYKYAELISHMQLLLPKFEKDKNKNFECRGNSGTAGEIYMAACMRLAYLEQSIEYVKSKAEL